MCCVTPNLFAPLTFQHLNARVRVSYLSMHYATLIDIVAVFVVLQGLSNDLHD